MGMPTERFYRLPAEKRESIRAAAVREFKRVRLESTSINRIIQDAEISRGSFYTYFEDKYELLKWIIGDRIREHQQSYVTRMEENGGNIWDTLEWIFEYSIECTTRDGFVSLIGNLVDSRAFSDFMKKECMEGGNPASEQNQYYAERLYQLLDKEKYPMSRQMFYDLLEIHGLVFFSAMKHLLADKESKEQVTEYYLRHIRMLRYGVCPAAEEHKNQERQEENQI